MRRTYDVLDTCHPDYGSTHAWQGTGLDNIDADRLSPKPAGYKGEVLCTTRKCVRCDMEQAKPYGHGGNKPWRRVTEAAA